MPEKEKLKLWYWGNSDIGLIRTENQDSFGIFPKDYSSLYSEKGQLFIVADGMGGHAGGKEASTLAINTIRDTYFADVSDTLSSLKNAVEKANSEIYTKSQNDEKFRGMGTTCTLLLLKENKGVIVHIGDSRIYRIDNSSSNRIEQLTDDHTKVRELVKQGILTKDEANQYPFKSVLLKALGVDPEVNPDYKNITIKNGQSYVICSDGLAGVTKNEIFNIVAGNYPEDTCDKLIHLANEKGGKDNVTALVIRVDSVETSIPEQTYIPKKTNKKYLVPVLITIFIMAAVVVGMQYKTFFSNFFESDKKENVKQENPAVNNKPKPIDDDIESLNKLQMQADKLYENGYLEKAFVLYKKILNDKPMHLGALRGINNIAALYISKADRYKNSNKYEEAIRYYKKSLEIQPANQELKKSIEECEGKLQNQKK